MRYMRDFLVCTHSTEGVIACMQTAQTNCIRVQKHIKLYNNPTPLEFNQATPNAYQMIAPWLFNNMRLSLTEAPLKKY